MPLSSQQIHAAVRGKSMPLHEDNTTSNIETNKVLKAVNQAEDASAFHEALHQYSIFARPSSVQDVSNLADLVRRLIDLLGTSADSWKIFTLTACLRRYHQKAPEARTMADTSADVGASVGDGERLVLYVTLLSLHYFWEENIAKDSGPSQQAEMAKDSAATLIGVAARIGGSRDLCAVIEHLTHARLRSAGFITDDEDQAPATFAEKLVPAVLDLAMGAGDNQPNELLELALRLTSQQLEQDVRLVQVEKKDSETTDILSTIHVTIPHNQRGSNTPKAWKRKLTNSLAEILIWQKTSLTEKDNRFSRALEKLKALPNTPATIEQGHAFIQQMQTTIRKQRQLLNNHSRQEGFLVTSSYLMDKASLTLRMIRRAKAGDLKLLQKMASKHADARVLKLIAKRNLDPAKATPIADVAELATGWIDIKKDHGDDEIAVVELALQTNTVQATLDKLRCSAERSALVTCVGQDRDNIICALLVAASLENSRLVLAGNEQDVSTTEKCVELINEVLANGKFVTGDDSLVSIEDILSDHSRVGSSQDVVVLSSHDLELDENALVDLEARDITLRVHATQKIQAETGQVELSLNPNIYERIKSKQPMTLGVMLDCTGSMGGEIQGCKKGALKLIASFQELAPVQAVNFMGYWDPVNVRSDPPPKSTGYLDTNQPSTMTALQEFVNTKLVCQGGGDEPEDIPQALEKWIADAKEAGLSADKGVHLLFFIADAGYRPNENARVMAALETLKKMGVVMVMCKVRGYGTMQTMMTRTAECFQSDGQYIALNGVGQLASIAASVTESIRASLFQSSTVKSVTASVGSTIDAIGKLARFQEDHDTLTKTKDLTAMEEEDTKEGMVFAKNKEYSLTSRDRLYLQLSHLPPLCHKAVDASFGGQPLQSLAAASIADRLRAEEIPVSEVKKAGYPDDVVEMVRNLMAGHGVKRVDNDEMPTA